MEHHLNWGLPVAIDLFAAAVGAGAFMMAVVADLAGGRRHRTTSFIGALVAPWPVIAGVLLLVIDLGKPYRFWEMLLRVGPDGALVPPYLMFKLTSTMSIGTWVLTIFVWVSFAYMVCHILSYPLRPMGILRKLVGIAGLPIALMVTIYTGVLLSASPNDLWSNWVLPIVFLTSAVATGIALVILVLALLRMAKMIRDDSANVPLLEKMMSRIIIVQIVAMVIFTLAASGSSKIGNMFRSDLSAGWWVLLLGAGLAVPLLMTVKGKFWLPLTALVAVLLSVEGYLFLGDVLKTSSMVVPIVFFCSAMVAGVVMELLVLAVTRMLKPGEDDERVSVVSKIVNRMMIVQITVIAIFVIAVIGLPEMANSQLGAILFVFVIGLGLVVPLLMTMKGKTWTPSTSLVTALLVLEGGFFLRYVILMAGQAS